MGFVFILVLFFFKQKTAYEMRISDWSSDVCSSDLVDLSGEAIRLGRVLTELMPDEPEAVGLLALMLLTEARRPARTAPDGSMVRLAAQDRRPWDREQIAEGHALVRAFLCRNHPGPFLIHAPPAPVHPDAPTSHAPPLLPPPPPYDHPTGI